MTATINASTSSGIILTSDTSGSLAIQSNGTTLLTATSTGLVAGSSIITSGTAQASTSGTSIDFTGIPSWVKRITVMLNGVSTNGTSNWLVQVGAGSIVTTGYNSGSSYTAGSSGSASSTAGMIIAVSAATHIPSGHMVFTALGSNTWVQSATLGSNANSYTFSSGGTVTLSGTLDRVRITTVNGTDAFDAGSINILYE